MSFSLKVKRTMVWPLVFRLVMVFLFVYLRTDPTLPIWSVPLELEGVFTFSSIGATLVLLVYFGVEAGSLAMRGRGLHFSEAVSLLLVPFLFNWMLLLVSSALPAQALLLRVLVIWVFNLVVVQLVALLVRKKFVLSLWLILLLLGVSVLTALAPAMANLPWRLDSKLSIPLVQVVAVIVTSVLSQAALWGQTYLVTGILMDALEGRTPSKDRVRSHWLQGSYRGAVYGGLFMTIVHMLAGGYQQLEVLLVSLPYLSAAVLGALLFPLVKTIVESFDGSAPFITRLMNSLRDPLNYLRGVVIGLGILLVLTLQLPEQGPWLRSTFGFAIGAMAYAGVHALRDGWRIGCGNRKFLQGWKVYALELMLGGVAGAALAWYGETSQLQVILQKFSRYTSLSAEAPEAYIIYPLFSKWGALNLGLETNGGRLLFNESLSGVIAWSLAAPLFSLNLVFLTALLQRSMRPIREFTTTEGLKKVILQTLRVERWGLWMAPIIYSFLRVAPDPEWYNQDGGVRTLVATGMSLVLDDNSFRSWSLNLFISLLAFDWLRILIWFDHMGLRVATLVNLSFVGGDMLDEKVARVVGYPTTTRYIPEGLRRFGTWMPLLLPFYIPRGQEWDVAWSTAEQMTLQAQTETLSGGIWLCAALVLAGGLLSAWWIRKGGESLRYSGWNRGVFRWNNESYRLELDAEGRGFSEARHRNQCEFVDITARPSSPLSTAGRIFYLVEKCTGGSPEVWSLQALPRPAPDAHYEVQHSPDKSLCYSCHYGQLRSEARVSVHDSDALERWDITLHNDADHERVLQIVSFRDLVLRGAGIAEHHPNYNDLHISTGFVSTLQTLFVTNRLLANVHQGSGGGVYFHALAPLPEHARLLGFQDSRSGILGAGSRQHPTALFRQHSLLQEGGEIYRFDPCASLGVELHLAPGARITVTYAEGWAANHDEAMHMLHHQIGTPLLTSKQLQQNLLSLRQSRREMSNSHAQADIWRFIDDGPCLQVGTNTPQPWFHPLANARGYGAFANNEGSVYSFCDNSQQNAITPFDDALNAANLPGQAWYFWDMDREESLLRLPVRLDADLEVSPDETLKTEFYPGRVKYAVRRGHFALEMDVFTLPDQPAEGRLLTLRNNGEQDLRIRMGACLQLVLAESPEISRGTLKMHWDQVQQAFFAENPSQQFCRGPAFIATCFLPETVTSFYHDFIGEGGTVETPHMIRTGKADTTTNIGYQAAAFTHVVVIPPGQSLQLGLLLGQAETMSQANEIICHLRSTEALRHALLETGLWWKNFLGILRVKTADPAFDRLVNDWLPYQLATARLWGRSGPFQRSGAYGFRDQLQDVMPLAVTHPSLCRQQILLHAAQQFLEGDVLQWWHMAWNGETGLGARNRASDIMLWLPYVTMHYCKVTGDDTIWNEELHFLEGEPIPPNAEGRVFVPLRSREKASLYVHCRLAVDLALSRLGERGLPLMGAGDWNDGLDVVGSQGKGESVWLGFFLYNVLQDFAPLVKEREGEVAGTRLHCAAQQLKIALDAQWRDQRYVRAITDEGKELVFDDALMSSWPILSGVADTRRGEEALAHGLGALECEELVLLLSPAFDQHSLPYPGRIAQYPPGVRENGSQYSHGSSWLVDAALHLADLLEKQGKSAEAHHWRSRAGTLWHKISPLTHSAPEHWFNYGLEPHQQAADVYHGSGYEGRGGWSWYTGSAARMLTAAHALLGMEFRGGQLHVADWVKRGDTWPYLQKVEWRGKEITFHDNGR